MSPIREANSFDSSVMAKQAMGCPTERESRDLGNVAALLRSVLVNAAHIIWSQAVRKREYAVLYASIHRVPPQRLEGSEVIDVSRE